MDSISPYKTIRDLAKSYARRNEGDSVTLGEFLQSIKTHLEGSGENQSFKLSNFEIRKIARYLQGWNFCCPFIAFFTTQKTTLKIIDDVLQKLNQKEPSGDGVHPTQIYDSENGGKPDRIFEGGVGLNDAVIAVGSQPAAQTDPSGENYGFTVSTNDPSGEIAPDSIPGNEKGTPDPRRENGGVAAPLDEIDTPIPVKKDEPAATPEKEIKVQDSLAMSGSTVAAVETQHPFPCDFKEAAEKFEAMKVKYDKMEDLSSFFAVPLENMLSLKIDNMFFWGRVSLLAVQKKNEASDELLNDMVDLLVSLPEGNFLDAIMSINGGVNGVNLFALMALNNTSYFTKIADIIMGFSVVNKMKILLQSGKNFIFLGRILESKNTIVQRGIQKFIESLPSEKQVVLLSTKYGIHTNLAGFVVAECSNDAKEWVIDLICAIGSPQYDSILSSKTKFLDHQMIASVYGRKVNTRTNEREFEEELKKDVNFCFPATVEIYCSDKELRNKFWESIPKEQRCLEKINACKQIVALEGRDSLLTTSSTFNADTRREAIERAKKHIKNEENSATQISLEKDAALE